MSTISTVTNQQIESLVSQYKSSISDPVTVLQNRQASLNSRLTVLADLKTKLSALNRTAKDLTKAGSLSKFNTFAFESSLTTVATGTATAYATASAGSHSLFVSQLAKADKVISSQLASSATTIANTEGAGVKSINITVNGATVPVNVTIADGDTNNTVLSNLASAINSTGAGVTASVVTDTTGTNRMVFTSKITGSAQAVNLADITGTVLNSIGLGSTVLADRTASTTTGGGFLYSSTSQLDAKFKLDGIDITRGTNSITDVLAGVTLELKGVQAATDTPVALNITSDKSSVKATVQDFITKYNDALSYLNSKTSVNPDNKTREALASDQVFKVLKMNMRSLLGGAVDSASSGNPAMLSQIGITAASDGTLSLSDSTKFDDAISADVRKVSDLFNSSNGIAGRLSTLLETFTSSDGQVQSYQDGTNSQILNLKTTIDRKTAQINARVAAFRSQYEALYNSMSLISAQSTSISTLITNLYG